MYRTIDLCAGIGGMRKAFEMTGKCRNVYSVEIDDMACKTYEANFGESPKGDITDPALVYRLPAYEILLAGFPCQTFSIAGKGLGFKDATRGTIFFNIADIIQQTRPAAFLLENVVGLIQHDKGKTFKMITKTLRDELGYEVFWEVLNTRHFGLPQNRPRVFIVGFKEAGSEFRFPQGDPHQQPKVKHVLEEEPVDPKYYLSQGYLDSLKRHKTRHAQKGNGFGYIVLDVEGVSNALLATGGSGKEKNLVKDERINLETAVVTTNKRTPLNNEYIRALTPREWSRLQGFEQAFDGEFKMPVSDTHAYKQLGNAVSIPVVQQIALNMLETLESLRPPHRQSENT